ncbi:MAG: mechanosensitive ion channel family protein [Gemmatimonadetes bacterium]|nr:mechanosensitive ion channel family protein [Gemmatimonadota bacterium]
MTLPTSLSTVYFNNPLRDWLVAMGGAIGFALAVQVLRRYVVRHLEAAAAKTETAADDYAVELLKAIRTPLVVAVAIAIAERFLDLPPSVDKAATKVMIVALAWQGLRWANKSVDFWVGQYEERSRAHLEKSALSVLRFAGRLALWSVIILVVLEQFDIEVKTLVAGLGVSGIAIALAVQNILGDLFAALSIWLDKPFVGGDSIAVDQFEGTVEHIGLKTTRVRSLNGEQLVFSNADLLRSRIRNYSRREGRRLVLMLSVAPATPAARLARVSGLIREALDAEPHATLVRTHLNGVGALGYEYETAILVPHPDYKHAMEVREAVLLAIFERFEREGIALAGPVPAPAVPTPGVA